MPRDDQLTAQPTDEPAAARDTARSAREAFAARWLLGVVAFAWYTAFSLRAEARYLGGFDLSIFDQAIANLSRLRPPVSDIKGFDLLGDHFHPIIAVVAPFYRIYPHASTLLVVQAAALAFSVVIVTKMMQEVFGPRWGLLAGFAYAISWGLQSALIFAFHEVSLGVPIIAGAAARYLRKDWAGGTRWALFLLVVKEDLPFTVAAFGVYLLLHKQIRHGIALIVGSVTWFCVVTLVIMPRLNPWGIYLYWPNSNLAPAPPGHGHHGINTATLWSQQKLLTVILVLAPMLFLALRSWLVIVLGPTLVWRFTSSDTHYWGTKYHYSEILMPITFLAGAAGAARIRWPWVRRRVALRGVAVASAIVAVVIGIGFPFWQAVRPGYWQSCPRCAAASAALAKVPSNVSVTADDTLLAGVVDRDTAHVLRPALVDGRDRQLHTDYVVVDMKHTKQYGAANWLSDLQNGILATDYTQVFARDGYVVYRVR